MSKNSKHHLRKISDTWYFVATKNGKRYRRSLSKNLRDAKKLRDQYLLELKHHGYLLQDLPTNPPEQVDIVYFGELAEKMREITEARIRQGELKESALVDFRSIMKHHLIPTFGDTPIRDITLIEIDSFIASRDCSANTICHILVPLRRIFKMAKRYKYIDENIMDDVKNPSKNHVNIHPLSPDEVTNFIQTVPVFYKPLFTTLFFTGMRFGEIAGLKWENVDLERKVIKIRETFVGRKIGKLKTKKSNRDIKILPPVESVLRHLLKTKPSGKDIVFKDDKDRMLSTHYIRKKAWIPTIRAIGLEYRPMMQTRHTFATLSIEQGEPLGWVQNMLGHCNLQMIITTYHSWINGVTTNDGSKLMESFGNNRFELGF